MTDHRTSSYREAEARLWASEGVVPREQFHSLAPSGIRVRTVVAGAGPPLVFVHGVNTAGAVWAPLVARLPTFNSIVLDRPGCGLSDPLPERVRDLSAFNDFADGLVAGLLDALSIERAHLVATSLGGYYAHRAAAAHPNRIASVTQLGWTVGAPTKRIPLVMRIGGARGLGRLMAKLPAPKSVVKPMLARIGLRQAIDANLVSPEMVTWFHVLLRHTDTMRNELDGSPSIIHPVRGLNEAILLRDDLLARIETPTNYLWGDGDPFGSPEVATAFVAKVRGSSLEFLPGAGHAPWIDNPDRVARATTHFIDSIADGRRLGVQ